VPRPLRHEAEQVAVVVELQDPGEGLQDLHRGATIPSLFQAQVVLRADPGEHRDLLATQARHPPASRPRDSDLVGSHELAARPQVVAQEVRLVGHVDRR
jgi:hypothetical protein